MDRVTLTRPVPALAASCTLVVSELKLLPVGAVPIDVVDHSPTAAEFLGRIQEATLRSPGEVGRVVEHRDQTCDVPGR